MIKDYLTTKKQTIDLYLKNLLVADSTYHQKLFDSMSYSLNAGGKRIRPILFLMGLQLFGIEEEKYMPVAAALECVHTYSLIHDDLPGMDNDDYRRGKLTNHKVYGTGMAIQAGDGLLTYAFQLLAEASNVLDTDKVRLIQALSVAAGPNGMVAGQAHDLEAEGKLLTERELRLMDDRKTGCLLVAPLDMACILSKASEKDCKLLHQFGLSLGVIFQMTDDLLDETGTLSEMGKEPGQDKKQGKSTYVTLLGKEETKRIIDEETSHAQYILKQLDKDTSLFEELLLYIVHRSA